ncbi:MAG: hypothetical protein QMC23_02655 [Rubritalea sp.]
MKYFTLSLAGMIAVLSTSCGTLPEKPKLNGPQSSESSIPWNRRLPGEGQGLLGGIGR